MSEIWTAKTTIRMGCLLIDENHQLEMWGSDDGWDHTGPLRR